MLDYKQFYMKSICLNIVGAGFIPPACFHAETTNKGTPAAWLASKGHHCEENPIQIRTRFARFPRKGKLSPEG